MSKPLPNVCQHAKRGICPTCADPMKPAPSSERNHTTDFGRALLAALPKKPSRRRNRRRHSRPAEVHHDSYTNYN